MFNYKKYINDCINKKINVCRNTYLAVKRHIDDIEKSKNKNYPYYFDEKEAERTIIFIQSLVHTKGEWANHSIVKICIFVICAKCLLYLALRFLLRKIFVNTSKLIYVWI